MRKFHQQAIVALMIAFLPGPPAFSADTPAPMPSDQPATKSVDELAEGLASYYRDLDGLPGLQYKYSMRSVNKEREAKLAFAWNDVKAELRHKGDMTYLDVQMSDVEGRFPVNMKFAWDGHLGRWSDAGSKYSLWTQQVDRQVTYAFFWRLFSRKHEIEIYNLHCTGWLKTVTERYALPGAVVDYKAEFRVRPKLERVDGRPCHVLERAGHDIIWLDTDRGSCPMRREYFREKERLRFETVVFEAFKELRPGFWFPMRAYLDVFASPADPESTRGKVSYHQEFKVDSAEIKPLQVVDFQAVEPRPGMMVYDDRTKSHFRWQPDGKTPFEQTIAESREWTGDSTRFRLVLKINVAILLSIAVIIVFRKVLGAVPK